LRRTQIRIAIFGDRNHPLRAVVAVAVQSGAQGIPLLPHAAGPVEAGRLIGQFLEDQEILFLEILRFNTPKTTEADIRNAIGKWPVPLERTIH
jgi:hypothetical protein